MAWRVSRGDNISIWKNAWVLGLKNHKIQESVRNHNLDKVVDLIDPILRQWKERIITSMFVRGEAEAILNTPLARYPREDWRVWSGEPIGDYTVRSGYRRGGGLFTGCTVGNRKGISPSSDRRGRFQEMQFGILIFYGRARDL
ncbi:hypothetical protein Golax_011669, partial [Gossypium laxum]|nr:hypothetical protein [Gossypium laxum]